MATTLMSSEVQRQASAVDLGQELVIAARRGDIERVREILAKRLVDPDTRDETGSTALMWAGWAGNYELAKVLLHADASPNAQNIAGETALMLAASSPRWVAGYRTDASQLNAQATLAILLSYSADVRLKDTHGNTALSRLKHDRASEYIDQRRPQRADEQKRRQRVDEIIAILEGEAKTPSVYVHY